MAKTKITALSTLADGSIANGDLIPIVDVDDFSQAGSGTTKKVTITSLATAVASAFSGDSPTFVNLNTTGTTTLGDASDATTINGTLAVGAITSSGALALGSNTITSGLINGQTISSTANFTGTLGVTGNATFDTNTFTINASTDQMLSRTSTAAINESTTQTGMAFNTNRLGDSVAGGLALTNNNYQLLLNRITATGEHVRFCYAGAETGSISTNGSATSYNTTSDYRLKENIVPMQDGLNNLIKIKPVNFNFIKDKNFKVDGFIAHEVNEVVPAAVTGLKDAVYEEDGQPRYQSLDNSKLIPLIVAAIQELSAKVTALEAK